MHRWLFSAALVAVALTGCLGPQKDKLPILAWMGPPAEHTTFARYGELRAAGFTHSFTPHPNADSMEVALNVAHRTGIKLLVACPELRTDPEGTVARFINHPANAGYYLRDEPSAVEFAELAGWVERIRAVDDTRPCYINLFPSYASPEQLGTPTYREHVERFVDEVPVQIISFDHYPVVEVGGQTSLRPEWYGDLEIVSEAARGAGKPLWAFALSTAHEPYPIPTKAHLRLQMYSNLAHGAQALQYFTYWTPVSTQWDFHTGPIESDGTRTPVYDTVREVTAELQARAWVFMDSEVLQVGHTGASIPAGTRRFEPAPPLVRVDTSPSGAVVSVLARQEKRFLVVVNRSLEEVLAIDIVWSTAVTPERVDRTGRLQPVSDRDTGFTLDPGDAAIFHWGEPASPTTGRATGG